MKMPIVILLKLVRIGTRMFFGFIPARKRHLTNHITDIQHKLEGSYNANLTELEATLLGELDSTLIQQDILWQ